MGEKGQISNVQAAMLAITSLTIIGHLILLTLVLDQSKQDGWLAGIVGSILSLIGILALSKLVQRFPGLSLIEILFQHFSWIGKILGIIYLLYFYIMAVLGVRLFGEAYKIIMEETPLWAFISVILLLTAFIVYLGLETLARINQIMLPVLVLAAVSVVFMTFVNDKDYGNLLPIMGNGVIPVAKGAVSIMGWFGEFVILGMVLPYVKRPEKLIKTGLYAVGFTLLFFLGPITGPVALFGPEEAANMSFPTFTEVRYIEAGEVVNRFDAIAILFWTVGLMVRISLFFYGLSLGTAQVLRISTYQPLIVPIGWLIGVGAIFFSKNFIELTEFLFKTYVPLNILMGTVLPLLFIFWAVVRRKRKVLANV
ncbi:GerAB/ArcD/ProY family transporter [Neobacillus sp. LXY-1]|uniref:GerAB/ArcD/ProY family transporter n=1 Tax=Neobacillus sp. LXY-1 TaxID=3379133 RepID=UPI003EE173DC